MKKLSKREEMVLRMLSDGLGYPQITARLGITSENLHVVCGHIRAKTGITSTKDAQECRMFFRKRGMDLPNAEEPKGLTAAQAKVLRLWNSGMGYTDIARATDIAVSTVQNHIAQGCARVGLTGLSREKRKAAIRAYLERLEAREGKQAACLMDDPMF